jgi:hypothetical protein
MHEVRFKRRAEVAVRLRYRLVIRADVTERANPRFSSREVTDSSESLNCEPQ